MKILHWPGVVTADLKVSISSTDADFVVKLIDVFPDDFQYQSLQLTTSGAGSLSYGWLPNACAW